jgi:hypothetical protein
VCVCVCVYICMNEWFCVCVLVSKLVGQYYFLGM